MIQKSPSNMPDERPYCRNFSLIGDGQLEKSASAGHPADPQTVGRQAFCPSAVRVAVVASFGCSGNFCVTAALARSSGFNLVGLGGSGGNISGLIGLTALSSLAGSADFFTSSGLAGVSGAAAGLPSLDRLIVLGRFGGLFTSSVLAGVSRPQRGLPSCATLSSLAGSAGFFTSSALAGERTATGLPSPAALSCPGGFGGLLHLVSFGGATRPQRAFHHGRLIVFSRFGRTSSPREFVGVTGGTAGLPSLAAFIVF